MEILFREAGAKGPHVFFKDKGGKRNHMAFRITVDEDVYAKLVYEDGSTIPGMFWTLKGVDLLDLNYQDVDGKWQDMRTNTRYGLRGVVNIRFKLRHVSRRHHNRNFILQFCKQADDTLLHALPAIEVRSKLKSASFYARREARRKEEESRHEETHSAVRLSVSSKSRRQTETKNKPGRSSTPVTTSVKRKQSFPDRGVEKIVRLVHRLQQQVDEVVASNAKLLAYNFQLHGQLSDLKDLHEIHLMNDLDHFMF